jgi:hypothetical protein
MTQLTRRWQACLSGLVLAVMCGCTAPNAKPVAAADESAPPLTILFDGGGTKEVPAAEFRFPDDRGGLLLARLLTPERQPLPSDITPGGARPRTRSYGLNDPISVLPPVAVILPQLPPGPGRTKVMPHLLLEETLEGMGEPSRLALAPLPEGQRIRQSAADINQPAPLPILAALPLTDRASLDDPTTEVSLADAILGIIPMRTAPAPFQKQILPDPFEFHHAVGGPVLGPADEEVPAQIRSLRP